MALIGFPFFFLVALFSSLAHLEKVVLFQFTGTRLGKKFMGKESATGNTG